MRLIYKFLSIFNIKNVFFTGKYLYENVTQLYHNSDVVWAAYPNKDFNVVYAISNKFHESLYVGIPCIYSDQTKLAELVKEKNIGFVVNPYDISSIKNLFSNIYDGTVNMEEIKENMKKEPKLDLNILTVAELKELAKKKEVKGYSKMKKEELIENLK